MPEIKDMYDRHPSLKSLKWIRSITVITRRVLSIDFYRLVDAIDNVYVIDIDSFPVFRYRFSSIAHVGIYSGHTIPLGTESDELITSFFFVYAVLRQPRCLQ